MMMMMVDRCWYSPVSGVRGSMIDLSVDARFVLGVNFATLEMYRVMAVVDGRPWGWARTRRAVPAARAPRRGRPAGAGRGGDALGPAAHDREDCAGAHGR